VLYHRTGRGASTKNAACSLMIRRGNERQAAQKNDFWKSHSLYHIPKRIASENPAQKAACRSDDWGERRQAVLIWGDKEVDKMKKSSWLIYHNTAGDAREKPPADKFYKKFGF